MFIRMHGSIPFIQSRQHIIRKGIVTVDIEVEPMNNTFCICRTLQDKHGKQARPLRGESGKSEALLRPLERPELCEGPGRGAGDAGRPHHLKPIHIPPKQHG